MGLSDELSVYKASYDLLLEVVRLMLDLKQVSLQKYAFINEKIENVSRQLSGWQKSRSREITTSGIQTGRN